MAVLRQIESRGLLKFRQYAGHEDMLCILIEGFDGSWIQQLDDNCSIEYNATSAWSLIRGLTKLFHAGKKITLDTQPYITVI